MLQWKAHLSAFMFNAVKKNSTTWNNYLLLELGTLNKILKISIFSVPKNVPRGFAPNQRTVLISSLKSNFIRLHSLIIANPMRHDDNYYKHDGTHRKLDKLRVYVISVRFNI